MTRIAIVGSREFHDASLMERVVARLMEVHGAFTLVSGGAKGTDLLGQHECAKWNMPKPIIFLPNSEKAKAAFGSVFRDRAFGRNGWIVDNADICVAFFTGEYRPNGRNSGMTGGTLNTVNHAKRKGILTYAYFEKSQQWVTIPAAETTGL